MKPACVCLRVGLERASLVRDSAILMSLGEGQGCGARERCSGEQGGEAFHVPS